MRIFCKPLLFISDTQYRQSHGFEWNLGIARVTGKVIAGAIASAILIMPVVSAIIPKLYENSCDYILIIYLKCLEQCCAEQTSKSLLKQAEV